MNERDFKIGDREFKLNKIDAFKQFHIARRLAPILSDIIAVAPKLGALTSKEDSKDNFDQIAELAAPVMKGFSSLSDADSNYVLFGLLSSVEIKQPQFGNYAFIVKDSVLMIQDLDMSEMLQIAGRALMYNMKGFFASTPQISDAASSKPRSK